MTTNKERVADVHVLASQSRKINQREQRAVNDKLRGNGGPSGSNPEVNAGASGESGERPDGSGARPDAGQEQPDQSGRNPDGPPPGSGTPESGPDQVPQHYSFTGAGITSIVIKTNQPPAPAAKRKTRDGSGGGGSSDGGGSEGDGSRGGGGGRGDGGDNPKTPGDPGGSTSPSDKGRREFTIPVAIENDFRRAAMIAREDLLGNAQALRELGAAIVFMAEDSRWRSLMATIATKPGACPQLLQTWTGILALDDEKRPDGYERVHDFVVRLVANPAGVVTWYDRAKAGNLIGLGNAVLDHPGWWGTLIRWLLQWQFPGFKWEAAAKRRAQQHEEKRL